MKGPGYLSVWFVVSVLCALTANAQRLGSGTSTGEASGAGGISNVTGTRSPLGTNATTTGNSGGFDQTRPIFLSGNVMFDDGAPPNTNIRIERVCSGTTHVETHTDSKGKFSFQVGGDLSAGISEADASNSGFGTARNAGDALGHANGVLAGPAALMGCELRASYPGYVSDSVPLSMRRSMDDPKVGTIILHKLGNVKGSTISVTTAEAPKSAHKNYEKGLQAVQKGKLEEAEQKFTEATAEYPKYAIAWFALGQVEQKLKKPDEEKKAYLAAMQADSHYVSPLDQLALLSAQQGKWEQAAKYSKEAVDLNPVEFPTSFWYNALANYNLRNDAEAEKSAQALVKLDTRHHFPEAEKMLAELAANRGDLSEASAHLHAYLEMAPTAPDADRVKAQLTRIDQARATQASTAPAAQPVVH